MTPLTYNNKNNKLALVFGFLLGAVLLLTACSGSDPAPAPPPPPPPPPPLPDQDASGLFKDGTAELDGGAIMLDDLRAFVHDGRLLAFSVSAHLLFDGQITSIVKDDYTATFDVYEQGVKTHTAVNVTGKVTSQAQMSGTLAGTGAGSGVFTLVFDGLYNRGATFARIDTTAGTNEFSGNVFNALIGAETTNLEFSSTGSPNYSMASLTNFLPFTTCIAGGTQTIPDSTINIYNLTDVVMSQGGGGGTCPMLIPPTNYSGLAAVIDDVTTDDTLIYAITNGTNSEFAVLTH